MEVKWPAQSHRWLRGKWSIKSQNADTLTLVEMSQSKILEPKGKRTERSELLCNFWESAKDNDVF